jgi:hypothetical protein
MNETNETIESSFDFSKRPETLPSLRRAAVVDIIHENLNLDDEQIANKIIGYFIEKNITYRNVCIENEKVAVHLSGTSYYFRKK